MAGIPTNDELMVAGNEAVNVDIPRPTFTRDNIFLLTGNRPFDYEALPRGINLVKRMSTDDDRNRLIKDFPPFIVVKGEIVDRLIKELIDDINTLGILEVYNFIYNMEVLTLVHPEEGWWNDGNVTNFNTLINLALGQLIQYQRGILSDPLFGDITLFKKMYHWFRPFNIFPENYRIDFAHFRNQNGRVYRIFEFLNDYNKLRLIDNHGDFIDDPTFAWGVVPRFVDLLYLHLGEILDGDRKELLNLKKSLKFSGSHVDLYYENFSRAYNTFRNIFGVLLGHSYEDLSNMMGIVLENMFFTSKVIISNNNWTDFPDLQILRKEQINKWLDKYEFNIYLPEYTVPGFKKSEFVDDLSNYAASLAVSASGFLHDFIRKYKL